ILAGLRAIPGVAVEGVWRSVGAPAVGGADAELVGQVAASPADGIATLVDAVPGLLSADWAAILAVPADWARAGGGTANSGENPPTVIYASWRAPQPLHPPEVTPLRPRAFDGPNPVRTADGANPVRTADGANPVRTADGANPVRYAAAPFGRAGLV